MPKNIGARMVMKIQSVVYGALIYIIDKKFINCCREWR